MIMTLVAAVVAVASLATAVFGGLVPALALASESLSLVLAASLAVAIAGVSALDG